MSYNNNSQTFAYFLMYEVHADGVWDCSESSLISSKDYEIILE